MSSPSVQDIDMDDTNSSKCTKAPPRNYKTFHRSCILRSISIIVAVASLLGAGGCFAKYIAAKLEDDNKTLPVTTTHTYVVSDTTAMLPQITTALSLVTTTLPEVTTTLPEVTTTLPEVTTTLPEVTTTLPEVTTTLPEATTTLPEVTTTLPEVTTTLTEATTTLPEVTTTLPEVTTTLTEVTTTLPEATTTLPEVTTTLPEVTTTLPPMTVTKEGDRDTWTDGCQVGYTLLAGTCIRLASDEKSHGEASSACLDEGATLAMPKTEELDAALRDLVKAEGGNEDHWIGMTAYPGGTWQWADGSFLGSNYKGWNPNEPNITGPKSKVICAQYWSGARGVGYPMWDDTDCPVGKKYICQAPPN
ncbi:hypothetical protein Bbelb_055460 [Branchiostoma belcheri]|nr:hypothetical protein Bbelb_055460 [Branchiostoma belcheri]